MSSNSENSNNSNTVTLTPAKDFIAEMAQYRDGKTQGRTKVKIQEMITNFVKSHGYTRAEYTYVKFKLPKDERHPIIAACVECYRGEQPETFYFKQRQDDFFLRMNNKYERQYEQLFFDLYTQLAPDMPTPKHDFPILADDGNLYEYDYLIELDKRTVCIEIGEQHNSPGRMAADEAKKKYALDHGWEYYYLNVKTAKTHPMADDFYELNPERDHIAYYDRMHEFICSLLGIKYEPHPDPPVKCLNE